jgi:hypothetical protein
MLAESPQRCVPELLIGHFFGDTGKDLVDEQQVLATENDSFNSL